jgi:hypothetical protein
MTEQTIFTPTEAINEFYRLKDKYENGYYEKYVKPIVKSDKSKREKRVDFSKLPKHECINCKRNVGTLFTIRSDIKEGVKNYKAKCGDIKEPCPLDIQINYAIREPIDKLIRSGLSEIEKIKLDIIKEKNNALFFNKNVVNIFEKITQDLKDETGSTGFIIETNILRNDNPEQQLLLKKMIDEFGKGCILPFKEMMKQYNETNNELILNQSVNFYITEMIPKLKEIQELKYDINIVEFDEINNIYKLIQLPNSLESNEYFYKEDDKVVKFIRGLRKEKNKTRKEEIEIEIRPKNKTRKIKPVAELVLEDEEDEIIEPGEDIYNAKEVLPRLEPKFGEEANIIPVFGESGKIEWNNKDYDDLWKMVPLSVKELLTQDKEWLVEYINSCYKLRKNGKPCELFLPKQTQFPPVLLKNGKYDFGSEIVNKLFNSFSRSYQDTLLSLYSVNNGVKDYGMLNNTLTSTLSKSINFERGYF